MKQEITTPTPDVPTYAEIIKNVEDLLCELNYQIASANGDTALLKREVSYYEKLRKDIIYQRALYSPDPYRLLP
jgi:hypothetical protein